MKLTFLFNFYLENQDVTCQFRKSAERLALSQNHYQSIRPSHRSVVHHCLRYDTMQRIYVR